MALLTKTIDGVLAEIRGKRSLQYGLLLMALLFGGELLLQWSDWQEAQEKSWQQLRGELRSLRNQSRDEAALRARLDELEAQQTVIDQRLWRVDSEAIGQAKLKDWLNGLLKKAGIGKFKLTLANPAPLEISRPSAARGLSGAAERALPAELCELRASLNFAFTPAALDEVLLAIEGGQVFAAVESLKVDRRDRSVNLELRVITRIQPAQPPGGSPAAAPAAEGKS